MDDGTTHKEETFMADNTFVSPISSIPYLLLLSQLSSFSNRSLEASNTSFHHQNFTDIYDGPTIDKTGT